MQAPVGPPAAGARAFTWAAAVAFAASLGYFLYSYAVPFGRVANDGGGLDAAAWNAGLFAVFALHHSVFARVPVRRRIAALLPGLERAAYVLVASLLLVLVLALWQPVAGSLWLVDGRARWLLLGPQLAGAWLALRSAASIDVRELAGVSTPGIGAPSGGTFVTKGPYGYVRHPIYLGWLLLIFAVPSMTITRLVFAVASLAYVLVAIPLEEGTLRSTSAGAYDRYMRSVRWRLLPGVF